MLPRADGHLVNFLTADALARSDNTLVARGGVTSGWRRWYGWCRKERLLTSELWQFAGAVGAFVVVALLWLRVVYLPGRTLERWEDRRPHRGGRRDELD